MAKNIQIFFVYNTNKTKESDCNEGILYFYPEWVSNEQKGALCGQIIGTVQCTRNVFSKPDIISLNNGKFIVIESGTLYFILGTDKNAPSTFLKYLSNNFYSSLKFFHLDVESLGTVFNSNNGLLQKVHNLFDGYLKMLNFSGKPYMQSPLRKSSSDIFMEAMQILECCRNVKNVLGGTIIYRNRLIATQLSTVLTQLLLFTGTGGVNCPAVVNKLEFDLPRDVKLYEVFVTNKEYSKLVKDTEKNKLFELLGKGGFKKKPTKPVQKPGDNSILSAMQREQSLIFTSVPEEGSSSTVIQPHTSSTKKTRPRFLNLENAAPKTNTLKNVKQFSIPHSSSQIIVCSTPLQEQKKIIHFNPLLICNNEDSRKVSLDSNQVEKKPERTDFSKTSMYVPFDRKSVYYKTLADPTFPKFKPNGKVMSQNLYQEKYAKDSQVSKRYEDLDNAELSRNSHKLKKYAQTPMLASLPMGSFINYKFKPSIDNKKSALQTPSFEFHHKKSKKPSDTKESETSHKCHLFLWQQEDVILNILLKREACEEKDTFMSLSEICEKYLTKLGKKLRNNVQMQNLQHEKDMNKFVILDTIWDGASDEWRKLNYFNQELSEPDLGEVLIRCDDEVFYGYHCGPTNVFYSEMSNSNGGLPLPTDPLGILQVKAKRRLEKEGLILL